MTAPTVGGRPRPHHDGSALHVPEQAPALGDTVAVFLRVPESSPASRVYLRGTPDGEPRFTPARVDRRAGGEVWWRAEVEVRNPVTNYRFLVVGADGRQRWVNALGDFGHDVPDNTDFRLVAYDPPPAWARDAVVYQIFPDRFARSAAADARQVPDWAIPCDWDRTPVVGRGPETPYQFYGGDLDGVAERLDHLDRLGVNTVYLTPIFPARSNHRYDAATFDAVDPLLGGDAALARLAAAVHDRGWRLLGDITSNHTGDSHRWFVDAISDVDSPERDLYYFDASGDYESWLGVKSLPKLNWGSPELRRRFLTGPDPVLARWLRPPYGLDGWRVDVANMTGRRGRDAYTHEVAAALRAAVTATRPDALVVAEHGHDFTGDLDADGWQGTMNYAGFCRPVWSWLRHDALDLPDFLGVPGGVPGRAGPEVLATMRAFGALVSWRALTHSWLLLGSHDSARIRTVVGDAARQEVAVGLLCTLPGTPMIFAGDELGLTGRNGEDSRTPMPWRRPESWDGETFERYRALVGLRRSVPALRHGGLRWAYADADSLVFLRESPTESVLVLARRASGEPVRLAGFAEAGSEAANLHGGAPALRPDPDGGLTLPGDGPTFQVWRLG
ncbi:glycoside hydrolase family 13 protein [Micromonospora sp. WMMD1102]|uniref:glycoside hydrolase family 13 protein n=1 Tax=Micromonospora sp. WMMD1102 TaxID=3016105 RepID=UPI0024158450|nr:glycoside hydrolase family 13 protein [Micromonospora sp. WMMD1102]MDG4791875.1 glycoside hydrolase family 13 protein [Micromonospora sp. WMMD1102]